MLVLSRKVGETIHVGDYVITVVRIDRNKVRIGVTAPDDVPVNRGEVQELIDAEKRLNQAGEVEGNA